MPHNGQRQRLFDGASSRTIHPAPSLTGSVLVSYCWSVVETETNDNDRDITPPNSARAGRLFVFVVLVVFDKPTSFNKYMHRLTLVVHSLFSHYLIFHST